MSKQNDQLFNIFIMKNYLSIKKNLLKSLTLLLLVGLLFSCDKEEEEVTPEMTITGKWMLTNTNYFGHDAPGEGSYLSFNECNDSICTGVAYKESDQSSGTFSYVLNGEESIDIIDDDSSKGGNWSGTWTITTFTSSNLVIEQTLLGQVMTVTFEK